ncbi:Levodione reductase [Streptomyces sp. ADI92-24]|nr:Levodione reductase [Streptomyces sp. ADI92-24]
MSTGRRVVVTAGAGGIGLVIAKTFAGNGDRVHICDVNEGALAKIDDENESITTTVCDVSDRSSVEAFVRIAADTLGGIDVLVNNAGISGPTASVEEMDPDQWDAVLAVNLTGTFNVTRLSIPFLRQSGSGVIINMSSVGGRFGYQSRSPYATTESLRHHQTRTPRAHRDTGPGTRRGRYPRQRDRPRRGRRRAHPAGTAKQGRDHRTQSGRGHRRRPEHPGAEALRRPCGHRRARSVPGIGQRSVDHRPDHSD